MREIQEENEDEGEWLGSQNGAGKAPDRSEKIPQKEEKAKATRRTRAPPRNDGNFVRLNLKRKTYSRGALRGKFLRKQVWKQKWRKKFGSGADLCFRCGGKGHWASECRGKDLGSFPEETAEEEETLPTLEDVARRKKGILIPEIPVFPPFSTFFLSVFPTFPLSFSHFSPQFSPPFPPQYFPPFSTFFPQFLSPFSSVFLHSSPSPTFPKFPFFPGISTLVMLPTGTGKSLCYQLPAFLYHQNSSSICLVISPLVSLMDDQVSSLPSALKAVCIHSNLTQSQREAAVEKIKSGRAQILLLSPESLVGSGNFSRLFRDFPPVAFACLDEVHCISQWSHNFRP
ncbi:RECQ4 helicase, partial [Spelaeornis formosus]|nr:RECQ4 helicase [Elachura formosa]